MSNLVVLATSFVLRWPYFIPPNFISGEEQDGHDDTDIRVSPIGLSLRSKLVVFPFVVCYFNIFLLGLSS